MSSRANGITLKNHLAIAGVLVGTLVLSGCSSLGALSDSSLVTGSIAPAAPGNLTQPMPGALEAVPAAGSPYLPPAEVGMPLSAGNPVTAGVSSSQLMPPLPGGTTPVVAQELPPVASLPQSPQVGSQQTMPAQALATPLFQDNPVPQVASTVPVSSTPAPLTTARGGAFEHAVETGESLYSIARRYDISTDAIVRANNLSAPDQIYVGQKLVIPGRSDLVASPGTSQVQDDIATASVAPAQQNSEPEAASQPVNAPVQVAAVTQVAPNADDFRWPVTGRVIVDFEDSRRTGINIEAPEGAAVRAAENGTVLYVGNGVEGYGNLILVRHPNGFVSAYAHMKDITVAKNDVVNRGDQIGTIGMTGSVNRPQLHFELRRGATPVDPMPLLAN